MASNPGSEPRSQRLVTREIVIGIALLAMTGLFWLNRRVLVLAFGALVFSTVIRSLANGITWMTKIRGKWAVVISVLVIAATLGGSGWLFGLRVADQFAQLTQQLPQGLNGIERWIGAQPHGKAMVDAIRNTVDSGILGRFATVARFATGAISTIGLLVFAAIYFALDPDLYLRGLVRLLPCSQRDHVRRGVEAAGAALSWWVRAQIISMAAVGIVTGVGLALVGVPLAFSLALIIGLFEFIPLIGPILGAIPGILLGFTRGPEVALYATLVYVAVQQLENNLLTPLVQRWAVELPPVLGLFSILIGGITFGFIGVIFATPLAVVAMTLVEHLYIQDALEAGKASANDRGHAQARERRQT